MSVAAEGGGGAGAVAGVARGVALEQQAVAGRQARGGVRRGGRGGGRREPLAAVGGGGRRGEQRGDPPVGRRRQRAARARQQLYDATYVDFLLQLAARLQGRAVLRAPAAAAAAVLYRFRRRRRRPPPPPRPTRWAAARRASGCALQLCAKFFFSQLLRVHDALLAPHLAPWLDALEEACGRSAPAAAWLLHALVAPRPPPPPAAGAAAAAHPAQPSRWLLGALFDCQSAAARGAVGQFCARLFRSVIEREIAAEADAGRRSTSEASSRATRRRAAARRPARAAARADAAPSST